MKLRLWLHRELFRPSAAGILINPLYITRKALVTEIIELSDAITGDVLDFGCGTKPYESLFSKAEKYVGLELEGTEHRSKLISDSRADIFYDGKKVPFPDEHFDSVVCFEMIDDVPDPKSVLSEIFRILRPGGSLLISSSFVWQEHELPNDFMRYTSEGLKGILKSAGFTLVEYRKTGNFVSTIVQLICAHIYETFSKSTVIYFFTQLFFIFPITLIGLVVSKIAPGSTNLYLGNIALVRKIK